MDTDCGGQPFAIKQYIVTLHLFTPQESDGKHS